MCQSISIDNFTQLNMDETIAISGGGNVTLFLGCVGLAVSPTVACLCPPAGAGLALVSGGAIINNWP